LGTDVRSARISLRIRDRSDGGQPRTPARIVWLDQVSLAADITLIPAAQRQALRDLYLQTSGSEWARQLNWMGAEGTECSWEGVTCNSDGDQVVGLALPANRLLGELPESLGALADLKPGEGLDVCWNDILVPESILDFVAERQLGGDPGHCQGIERQRIHRQLTGHIFQPQGRTGEGFMLHMLSDGAAVLHWASYDQDGEPVWLVATGRAQERVIHFHDLYHTFDNNQSIEVQRVGRASLVLAAQDDDEDCLVMMMRFHVEGELFGAGDGRQLRYLDGTNGCYQAGEHHPLASSLAGSWYDPALVGQGISLMPYSDDRVLLNWYRYDDFGQQIWFIGTGQINDEQHPISFDTLLSVSGGTFNDSIDPAELIFEHHGMATLSLVDDQWYFRHHPESGPETLLALTRIQANPDLLASSGQRVDLEVSVADLDELYSRPVHSDDRLPGRVRFNQRDEVHELTGFRFRGSSSRLLPKKSFNIRFEQSQALLFGSDRMNLNAMYTDAAMMREALAFSMFHELGLPASRTRHFDLWINGIYEGLYVHIQRVDENLLVANGLNPEGTLVRDGFRDSDAVSSLSVFGHDFGDLDQPGRRALIEDNFDFRNDPDWDSLVELVDWVNATPAGPDFAQGFKERFDSDQFTDWLVLHWLMGDIDSFGDDYWLYLDHDDSEALWRIIPWDKDQTFGSHWRDFGFATANDWFAYEYLIATAQQPGNALVTRFMQTPELRQAAESRALELLEDVFTEQWFLARIEKMAERFADSASIKPSSGAFIRHNQNHHSNLDYFEQHVEVIKDYVELRQRFLQRQMQGQSLPHNQAGAEIVSGSTEKHFLVDGRGAALAALQPLQPAPSSIELELHLAPAPEQRGIDRVWELEVSGSGVESELTLYYSNEISEAWSRGNWWTEGDEPVGRQSELAIRVEHPDGLSNLLATRVNPYSNKAVATLTLEPGSYRFWLQLPDDAD
jgi:spore coat protein H